MSATREIAMEHKVGRHSFRSGLPQVIRAAAMSLLLAMILSATAWAQTITVTGTVTTAGGGPLQGVTVRVRGTEGRSLTNQNGKYTISAPSNGALVFTRVGQKPGQAEINGRTTVDVTMEAVAYLEEVVVTAYTEQR